MSRWKRVALVAVALAAVAAVAYWAAGTRPQRQRAAEPLAGLNWLPAESGLVAGINLAEVRQQAWVVELLGSVAGEETAAPDYQAFVEATGFDYTRDLDRLWLGVFGASDTPTVAGVAEGRFVREKITDHARRQGGRVSPHGDLEIYEVETLEQPPRRFAFAFLDETHVAFGSSAEAAAQVVDCWREQAPAVGTEPARRAELERLAGGRPLWAVDELEKWQPQFLRAQKDLQATVTRLAMGLAVRPEGLELEAEALCREPQQAQRLNDNLRILALTGRLALARATDPGARLLSEALANLQLKQESNGVQARVLLARELVAAFLGAPRPGTPAAPGTSPR